MADRIILPRAFDSNGNIVAGARAYFYDTGTTDTQEVYSDSAGTVPVSQPLTADAAGAFAATFATDTVKVDIQDTGGTSLPGFPSDPHPKVPATGSAASAVSFVPSTENPATNVQDAIDDLTESPDFSAATNKPAIRTALGLAIGTDVVGVANVLDEDDMATNSAVFPPTQQSIKAYVDSLALGVGQTWADLSASRVAGTWYQNTTGRTIFVSILGRIGQADTVQISNDGGSTAFTVGAGPTTASQSARAQGNVAIPDEVYYRATGGFSEWHELR